MKKWKKTAFTCGLIVFPLLMQAQEAEISKRIGVEFGVNVFIGKTVIPERVDQFRTDKSIKSGNLINNTIEVPYVGIKYEQYYFEKRMEFSAGLRFSQFSSAIHGRSDFFLFFALDNSFLWRFHEDGTYIDYLNITRITQNSNYLGIPLEWTYLLKGGNSYFRPYVKVGVVVNKRLYTTNSVVFESEQMNQYADAVGKQVPKPNSFNSYFYPSLGFKLGKNYNSWSDLEIQYLPFIMGKKAHPFISDASGVGIQLSIKIPLNNKSK